MRLSKTGWSIRIRTKKEGGRNAMKPVNRSRLNRNWFRAMTLCLTFGFVTQLGYSFQNQEASGQQNVPLKETLSAPATPTRPAMEEFLLKAKIVSQRPLSLGVTNSR